MKDANMVERYSKHLTAILLSSHEGFLKQKYEAHVAATQPKEGSFFDRMQKDAQERGDNKDK